MPPVYRSHQKCLQVTEVWPSVMAFCFKDFDAFGFDVDHALVQYRLDNLYPLVYYSLVKVLVETKDYPKEILKEPFEQHAAFCTRGLILEVDKGNLVKISKNGKVLRASHGTKLMNEKQLKEEYGEDKEWKQFQNLMDDMKHKEHFLRGAKFRMFENFFDIPAIVLCARLIDLVDQEEAGKEKYRSIWPDVLSSLIENFDFRSFKENKGYFYPAIKADVYKYVRPCSNNLKQWLKRLRTEGKKMFLITNSQADFSMFILEAAFGKDWLSYFDVAVSRAGKPGFFRNQHHFKEVVNGVAVDGEVRDLEEGKYYAEGNSADFERFLEGLSEKTKVKVLFFGDSVASDVLPPKFFSNWSTVALLEELDAEIRYSSACNHQETRKENSDNNEPDSKKARTNEPTGNRDNNEPDSKKARPNEPTASHEMPSLKRTSFLQSSVWGSVFGEDGELVNTLFSGLIDEYSSLVIPDIDCVSDLNTQHCFVKNSTGSCRFYPQVPEIPMNTLTASVKQL